SQAVTIMDAGLAKARALQLAPITVAVLDAGGHLIALKREDGSGILRADIATAKAWGALGMGMASRGLAERAAKAPQFYAALNAVSQGRLIPGPGGVLIRHSDRTVIGAVGISGDTGENDESCAIAGVAAAGLASDPPGGER
ncbi:MAG: GlcG/HbpS family heme-binding protein, partial [Solimonas sp.]